MVEEKKRNFGLDLMRFTAIAMVLIHHWVAYNLNVFKPLTPYTINVSLFGYYGVEIFFVLSGFLIGNIIIKTFIGNTDFTLSTVRSFWMRRWFRTLPLYYIVLAIHVLISLAKHESLSFIWKYVLFVQNFFTYITTNNNFYGESWSLAIEEWFYLSFPLLLIVFNFLLRKRFSKQRILAVTILFYIIIPTLIRLILVIAYDPSWNDVLRKAVICREDSIAFGLVGAYLFSFYKPGFFAVKNVTMIIGCFLLVVLGYIYCVEVSNAYYNSAFRISFFSKTILFSLVSFAILLTLPFLDQYDIGKGRLRACITYISKISYSLYLVHLFVERLSRRIFPADTAFFAALRFVFFFAGALLLASLTFKFIEEKFLIIRDSIWKEKYKPV